MPVVEADDVLAAGDVLVDARAPERYRGEVEPVDPVAGHIPGAVNVPTEREPRRGRPLPAARRARARCTPRRRAGATSRLLRLGRHRLPRPARAGAVGVHAALYPGSWSEWVTDPERPVETS